MSATTLVFDPSPAGRIHLTELLQATGQFDRIILTGTRQRALTLLEKEDVDMVVIGWRMDTIDPAQTMIQDLQRRESWSDLPLAAVSPASLKVGALEAGIGQIFEPGAPLAEITAGIRLLLRQRNRLRRLRQDKEHLSRLALTDALTGMYNRAYFEASLEIEIARGVRTGDPCSLLLLDLDHFKSINDTYGHAAGDRVLQMVAESLKEGVRRSDVLCRFGGEEFAVILPATAAPAAFTLAERLRRSIAQLTVGGPLKELRLSASLGISGLCERRDISPHQLIEEADCALYRSKRSGRNRTEIFTTSAPAAPGEDFPSFNGIPVGYA